MKTPVSFAFHMRFKKWNGNETCFMDARQKGQNIFAADESKGGGRSRPQ